MWHDERHCEVTVKISKDELLAALCAMTIESKRFYAGNAREWSMRDVEKLEAIASMIKREIKELNDVPF